eukprot:CAMPEP_0118843142 /NCGR_PEP_ID=MMETSP1162-20130426/81669_1 /TAXON_ID=33656 /ORGANISM="Phaeocystis Sp, Strain CCMP2710" /LENGTH=173 /DNA_ID=CAMNT_0006775235 /DNA_START=330 /DNA_END=847 /DNA_ORIENTATION=-
MPPAAQMDQRAAAHVLVLVVELPVLGLARVAAEGELRSREDAPQAHVEGHVAVVGVHVQAEVLACRVLDHEGVVAREAAPRLDGEEQLRDGQQHLALQPRDHALHADLVYDDAVVIHRVRARLRQAGAVVVVELLEEAVAELGGEDGEGVDGRVAPLHLDAQQRAHRALIARS